MNDRKLSDAPRDPLDGVATLFRILAFLREKPEGARITRDALASEIGYGTRHTQRFLTYLANSGFLEYDRHLRTYLLLERGARFPLLDLEPDERIALAFAAALFGQQPFPFSRQVHSALMKASTGMTRKMRDLLRDAARSVVTKPTLANTGTTLLLEVLGACQSRRTLEIDYTSQSRGRERRRIDPYGIDLDGAQWYVHAWCHANTAIRTFRLGAFHDLTVTNETFVRREEAWDAFRHAPGVFLGLRGGAPVAVEVLFRPEVADYALRKTWPEGMNCTSEPGGGARLAGTAQGIEGILVELLRWRRHATVLGGPELHQAMADEVAAMAKNYENSSTLPEQGTNQMSLGAG